MMQYVVFYHKLDAWSYLPNTTNDATNAVTIYGFIDEQRGLVMPYTVSSSLINKAAVW